MGRLIMVEWLRMKCSRRLVMTGVSGIELKSFRLFTDDFLMNVWVHNRVCLPSEVGDTLDSLPHLVRVIIGEVIFEFLFVVQFCFPGPLLQVPLAALCSFLLPDLKTELQALRSILTRMFIQGFWLGSTLLDFQHINCCSTEQPLRQQLGPHCEKHSTQCGKKRL